MEEREAASYKELHRVTKSQRKRERERREEGERETEREKRKKTRNVKEYLTKISPVRNP
jgi:hypothetical protein